MTKILKRPLSVLLAVLMVMSVFIAVPMTAPMTANAATTVDYQTFFVNGISGGTNYDVVEGTGAVNVTGNTTGRGVTWDATEKCAVFDGEAYLVIPNPLRNANASTGFTITMEAYISSANKRYGGNYYINNRGQRVQMNGWQRLFDLSNGTIQKYLVINAGAAAHLRFSVATTGAPDRGGDEQGVTPSGVNYYDAWHTYSLVVKPGGNMYLYVDGTQIASLTANNTVISALNQLSSFNTCYIGTGVFETTNAASDGFFIGKIRGFTTVNTSEVFTLSYNTNGGAQNYNSVSTPIIPADLPTPTKANNVFGGWYTNSQLTQPAISGTKLTANTTLYAKWNPLYTVTYKVVNGTWSNGTTANRTETVASGSKPASVPTGMKPYQGYTDGAWNANPTTATIWGNTTFTYTFKVIPVVTGVTAKSLTYNTQSQTLVNQGSTTGGTLQYSLDGVNYSANVPTATNAGTYTVYYKVQGNSNYSDLAAQTVKVTIKKAVPTVTAPTANDLTYNKADQALVSGAATTGGTMMYKLLAENEEVVPSTAVNGELENYDFTAYSADVPEATPAGAYTVAYGVKGDSNYFDVAPVTVGVTIKKAVPTVTAPTANDLTYNKADQALVSGAATTGGTMMYKLLEEGETVAAPSTTTGELEDYDFNAYGTDVPETTPVGAYTVAYGVKGDSNYFDVAPVTVAAEIKKATPYVELKTKTRYYNKAWQQLVLDADVFIGDEKTDVCDEAKIWFSLEGGLNELDYSPVGKEIGTYEVYTRIEALSDNLNPVEYVEDVFTPVDIKAGPTVVMSDYTYNTTLPTPSVEDNIGNGTVTYYYYPADGDKANAKEWKNMDARTLDAGDYKMYAVIAESDTALGVTTESVDFTVGAKTVDAPTITYSPADNTYNGNEIIPAVTVKDGDLVIDPSEYTVTYSENINAGTATITITDAEGGNYTVSGTKTFVIKKAPINPTVTIAGWTYGEDANEPVVTGNTGNGAETITYKVKNASDDTYTAEVPVNAGTYTVKLVIAETDNYLGKTVTSDFTIAKAPITPTVTINNWIYSATPDEPQVTGNPGNGDVTYLYKRQGDTDLAYTADVPVNAGEYTVKAVIAETANYNGGEATADFTIAKADIAPEVTIEGWTYGDEANEPVVTGNDGEGEVIITYAAKDSDEFTADVPENAGEYTVKAVIAETANYNGAEATADFTIAKADITPTVTIEGWTYGEEANEPEVTGNTGNGDVTITYAVKDSDEFTADVPENAGDYTVKAVIADTANYKGAEATADFTIAKADITPTVTIEGWTYGEDANEPEVTGNTGNGEVTITYAAKDSDEFTADVPANAGDYTVKAVIAETDNYNGAEATADFTIAKEDIDPAVTIEGWTYGDEANEPVVTGNTGNGDVTYLYKKQGDIDLAYTADVPVNAGDYTVKAIVATTTNYLSGSATADFTIEKKDPEMGEGKDFNIVALELIYNNLLQNLITEYVKEGSGLVIRYSFYPEGMNPQIAGNIPRSKAIGEYKIYFMVEGTNNYNDVPWTEVPLTATIEQETFEVTIEGWAYGEDANDPVAEANFTDYTEFTYTYAVKGSEEFTAEVPENVGEYTVKASITSDNAYYSTLTATADFTIVKADITPAITLEGWTYGEEANEPEVTGNTGEGEVTITYAVKDSDEFTADVPTEAGDYTVKAVIAETDSYNGAEATADFTIAKADFEPTVTIEGWTYGEDANEPEVTGNTSEGEVTITYAVKDSDEFTADVPENAGDYTVKAVIAETDNYNSAEATADFTIAKADITPNVTVEGWTYGEYDETVNGPSVSGNTENGDVTYLYKVKDADDETYTDERPENAGDYTVKAVVAETADYNGAEATADFTITKAAIDPEIILDNRAYSDEANDPSINEGGNPGNGDVEYTYAYKFSDAYSAKKPVYPGTYTVKAVIAETDNYLGTTVYKDFVIKKGTFEPTVTLEGWLYGEEPNEPELTGNISEGAVKFTYAPEGSDAFSATVPTTPGSYVVKATIASTDLYDAVEATAAFEIGQSCFTITWKNGDTVLETDTDVEEGADPIYNGDTPKKAPENGDTYEFDGWTPDIVAVTENAEYTAKFKTIKLTNTSVMDEDDIELGNSVTVSASAEGASGEYLYAIDYKTASDTTWIRGVALTENKQLTFTPAAAGKYSLRFVVQYEGTLNAYKYATLMVHETGDLTNLMEAAADDLALGEELTVTCAASGGYGDYRYAIDCKSASDTTWQSEVALTTDTALTFTPESAGAYTLRLTVSDAKGDNAYKYVKVLVRNEEDLTNEMTVSSTDITLGENITITCAASGGYGGYRYAVEYKTATDTTWQSAVALTTDTALTFTPVYAGAYTLRLTVRDAKGNNAYKYVKVVLVRSEEDLTNEMTVSAPEINLGEDITVTCEASGGYGDYRYAIDCKSASDTAWQSAVALTTDTALTFTPDSASAYTLRLTVRDAKGNNAYKYVKVLVRNEEDLSNDMTVSSTDITLGEELTVTCAASGGYGGYRYAIDCKSASDTAWQSAAALTTDTALTFNPESAGAYTLRLTVRDAKGDNAYKYVKVLVRNEEDLTNEMTVSSTEITLGEELTFTCAASGGYGGYRYAVEYKTASDTTWQSAVALTTDTELKFTPTAAGKHSIRLTVQDAGKKNAYQYVSVKVKEK